ncbi:MAG: FAD-dependent oxidoreductase [Metamycoplasmataceae bacterium]
MKRKNKKNNSKNEDKVIFKYIVLGAGLTGLTFAKKVASPENKVLLIDKNLPGIKSSLNIKMFSQMAIEADGFKVDPDAFFNSFSFRINSLNKKLNEENAINKLEEQGIIFKQGEVEIEDENTLIINGEKIIFKYLIFATGSHFDSSNIEPGFESFFMTSDDINKISKKYESIAIYGTNATALEIGQAFSKLGSKVHLIDKNVNPLNDLDDEIEAVLKKEYSNPNIDWCLEMVPKSLLRTGDDSIRITLMNNNIEKNIEVNKIILTENIVPTTEINSKINLSKNSKNAFIIDSTFKMKGNTNFFAIGGTNGIQEFANQGFYQATLLANYFLKKDKRKFNTFDFCWSLNTSPAISFFGMSKKQIDENKINYNEFIFEFKGDYKSSFKNDVGRIKVFTNSKHELLGAILIGNDLSDFILLFTLMKENKIKFYEMEDFNLPFFTKSEALRSAALAYKQDILIDKKNI